MGTSSSTENAVQCSINKTVNKVTEEHELELDENVVKNSDIEHDEDQIDISVHEIVCNSTTQHVCSFCGKKVCQIFCSEQDPNSTNGYHRKHKDNDLRCTPMKFNCPFCNEEFVNKNNFDDHMNNHNENSYDEMTQLSRSEDSLWKYSLCKLCGKKFNNELDVKEHMDNWHGKRFYCQQCSNLTRDNSSLESHMTNIHPDNLYRKRIRQNHRGIDLEEESEYIPSDNDDVQENDNFLTRKRKRIEKPAVNSKKKSITEFSCERCESTFSRKDSLNRWIYPLG